MTWCDIIAKLIDHGADVNGMTLYGETPLRMATVRGDSATEHLPLCAGAKMVVIERTGSHNLLWQ